MCDFYIFNGTSQFCLPIVRVVPHIFLEQADHMVSVFGRTLFFIQIIFNGFFWRLPILYLPEMLSSVQFDDDFQVGDTEIVWEVSFVLAPLDLELVDGIGVDGIQEIV
jgi:hypothetical protein